MSAATDLLTRALGGFAAKQFGEPITIDVKTTTPTGQPQLAIVDKFRMSREMRENGFRVDYELTAFIALGALACAPAPGMEGVYQGRKLRIVADGVQTDCVGYTLKLAYVS